MGSEGSLPLKLISFDFVFTGMAATECQVCPLPGQRPQASLTGLHPSSPLEPLPLPVSASVKSLLFEVSTRPHLKERQQRLVSSQRWT